MKPSSGDIDIDVDAETDLEDLGETAATLDSVTELTGPVEATVDPIADTIGGTAEDVPDTITDKASTAANDLLEILAPEPTTGDTDLTLNAGVDVIDPFIGTINADVNFDAIEAVVADIDVDGNVSADLMELGETTTTLDAISDLTGPVETTVDPIAGAVESAVTDIPAIIVDVASSVADGVFSSSEPPPQNRDTDLTVDASIDGADTALGTLEGDITLDPIEDILGDIDIDIEATDASVDLFDAASGGSGSLDSAFQPLEDSASTLDDDTFGSLSDLGSSVSTPDLPEPAGSISEGIGHVIDNAGLGHGHLGTWF